MIPPTSLFLFQMVAALLGPGQVNFIYKLIYINKNVVDILTGLALNLQISWGRVLIVSLLSLLMLCSFQHTYPVCFARFVCLC